MKSQYDVVILGAGHNGLVAASYLGRAGLSVLLLEKNNYIGGAATSQKVFPDYDAQLSRYSYLVSLFPEKIIRDLGLNLELRRRATASFTPYLNHEQHDGLLLSNVDEELGRQSMFELTGNKTEFEQMKAFYNLSRVFAENVWDTMLQPLIAKENRCFIYHLIGNKTGEWKVPVGGMGALRRELEQAARKAGAEILTSVELRGVGLTAKHRTVQFYRDGEQQSVEPGYLLVNFGRNVLAKYVGKLYQPNATDEGSVFKINMLLQRLPKLKATTYPLAQAWCGTFHSDEGYDQMNASYDQACSGRLPNKTPCEVYCHTLTDDSILASELREKGFHTMTLFGLDAPWNLFARDNRTMRKHAEKKFIQSINQWLDEPLEDCLAVARDGSLCIESKSPVDIEDALGMFQGNIFQNAPTFPFAERKEQVGTWGVETDYENVFFCGSSACRGGAVSGIPGHNAAMKVLEIAKKT
jgi:phytoene dehydrogenase-like protein